MFEVLPVVNQGNESRTYFRDWWSRIQSGEDTTVSRNDEWRRKLAQLETYEDCLCICVKQINNKFVQVGEYLNRIMEERLFTVDCNNSGAYFDNIYAFALHRYGLKRTTTFLLISVAKEFAYNGQLKKEWKDFSYSQLCEILPMSEELRKQVKSSMTIKQLRELKAASDTLAASVDSVQTSECEDEVGEDTATEIQTSECPHDSTVVHVLTGLLADGLNRFQYGKFVDTNGLANYLLDNGVKL